MLSEKNKNSWNQGAAAYSAYNHSGKLINRILENPISAFHHTTWELLQKVLPDMKGKRICVPSSGDNHAVFAFAMLGAKVTSCDIAENQLENARQVAERLGWDTSIEFICTDTMALEGVADGAYDFVYTSNGVHVWIDDLPAMYRNICRVMKPGAAYLMYEIHPFQRPFGEDLKVMKPYDWTGPFEDEEEVTFHWRMMDIVNAMLGAGLTLTHMEEMFTEKDYERPFWLSCADIVKGVTISPQEVDRMHDWRQNPGAALPSWLSLAARK